MKRRHGEVSVVPNNTEKFITFTIGDVVFKDSYAFTQSSLDSLVDNLQIEQLRSTRRWLENSVTRTYDNLESLPAEEEEEEPDFDDIMFIDDRDEGRRRYAFFNDNDEPTPSSSSPIQQPTMFTSRSCRQRTSFDGRLRSKLKR